MKRFKNLSIFLILLGIQSTALAQGNGNGNGNGGQPGSSANPYENLFVNKSIKIGTNSLWLNSFTSTGIENRLFSTDGPLSINGTFGANGLVPGSTGNNTLLNSGRGNVGIGLTNPAAKLDINIGSSYNTLDAGVRINIPITKSGLVTDANIFQIRKEFSLAVGGGTPFINRSLFLVKDNGFVGVGMESPESKLHVHNGQIKITGTNSYGGPMILFGGSATVAPAGHWGIEYVPNQNGLSGLNFWKPWGSTNPGNYYMFLADNGKISIGLDPNHPNTFKGDYKLYVGTGIMTEKIRVAIHSSGEWADYVFKPDYHLMPLAEVQQYILKEGHLPNIPSAGDVVEQGLDLAKMDAKLLEKIEELTLYLLVQQKQIEDLKLQIEKLK